MKLLISTLLLAGLCTSRSDLRGTDEPSADGGTFLSIDDDNGGGCPLTVDGKPWKLAPKALGAVKPGRHKVACGPGSSLDVTVRAGRAYHFDYWGP